jgi:hypothetical protein
VKTGKTVRDIFASTASGHADAKRAVAAKKPIAANALINEPYTKATVVLRNSQIVFLDRIASDIRAKTGAAMARAELIRAMVDAVFDSGVDLSSAASEEDVRRALAGRLGAKT